MGSSSDPLQVSKPIVIPDSVGDDATAIAQHLASLGDNFGEQAQVLMPLGDLTGKSMAQIFSEGLMALESGGDTRYLFSSTPSCTFSEDECCADWL